MKTFTPSEARAVPSVPMPEELPSVAEHLAESESAPDSYAGRLLQARKTARKKMGPE